jgi:oligosaccharyl transferase (archaeosortase A-associated)
MSSSRKKSRAAKAQKPKSAPVRPQEAREVTLAAERQQETVVTAIAETPATAPAPALMPVRRVLSTPVLFLLGILAVALVVRLLPVVYSFSNGHILLYDQDSYYHLRRITSIVQHFPGVNIFDSYVNYPDGYFIGWPPLYDLAAATAAMIVGLGHPGQMVTEAAASSLNVALGLLGIVAAYYLGKDILGEKVALTGAFVMAILPATAFVTNFGYIGHHSLEIVVSLAMYLLFLRSATRGKAQGLTFSTAFSRKEPMVYAALSGVAIAAAIFSWDGAPFFIGVIALFAFAMYVLDAFRKESSDYLTVAGIVASVVALALVAPVAATSYYGQRMEITAIYMSWFHIAMLAGFAAFFIFMGALSLGMKKARAPWYTSLVVSVVAAGVGLVAIQRLLPGLYDSLFAAVTFMTGGSTVLSSISEVSPLLSLNGHFSLAVVWSYFGTALIIAVPAFLVYLYRLRKTRIGPAEVFFLLWTGVVAVMNLMQSRFVYLLGINIALLTGYGIYMAADAAGLDRLIRKDTGGDKHAKRSDTGKRPRLTAGLAIVMVAAAVLLLQPLAYACMIGTTPLAVTGNWDDAAQWIKDNTPATSYTYSADIGTLPEYSVMTWWDYGNYILYRGERPAVANNFQTGVYDSADFFLARSEPAADQMMERHNAKYVVVDYLMGSASIGIPGVFDSMATLAGENASQYFMSFRRLDPSVGGTMWYVDGNDRYYGSMYSRLYNDRGLGGLNPLGNTTSGLQHYRMVYANTGTDPVIVFEKVAGATITGSAQPGSRIELALNVSWGAGSRDYYSYTTADQEGAYSFTVPYPTGVTAGPVTTGAHYVISSGGKRTDIEVAEDAVEKGTSITAGGLL